MTTTRKDTYAMPTIQKDTYAELCLKSTISRLRDALTSDPLAADMYEWGLTAKEWRAQVELALSVKLTTMTPEQFRNALKALRLSYVQASKLLGVSRKTVYNHARYGASGPAVLALRLMMEVEDTSRWIPSRLFPEI